MKWLEIIELRSLERNRTLLASQLQKLIREVDKEADRQIVVYGRVMIDTDFSIHVLHDSNKVASSGSSLGLRLADGLKEYGLVNHSVWLELPGNKCFDA